MSVDPTRIDLHVDPTVRRMRGVAIHGNTPFDVPYISELAENLWQGGCATGLVLPDFVDHVVSLYPWERYLLQRSISSELYVRMYDSSDQAFDQVDELARWVNDRRKSGTVLVHCQAGLNRSSLIAARALMMDAGGPWARQAVDLVRARRSPACLCNKAFEQWLLDLDR